MKSYEFQTLLNCFYTENKELTDLLNNKNNDRYKIVKQIAIINKIIQNMEQYKKSYLDEPDEINHLKKSSK
jgi:hypothetical protein